MFHLHFQERSSASVNHSLWPTLLSVASAAVCSVPLVSSKSGFILDHILQSWVFQTELSSVGCVYELIVSRWSVWSTMLLILFSHRLLACRCITNGRRERLVGSNGQGLGTSGWPHSRLSPDASNPRLRIRLPNVFFLTSLLKESSVSLSSVLEVLEFTLTCCHPLPLMSSHLLHPADPPIPHMPLPFESHSYGSDLSSSGFWLPSPPFFGNPPVCSLGTFFHTSFLLC